MYCWQMLKPEEYLFYIKNMVSTPTHFFLRGEKIKMAMIEARIFSNQHSPVFASYAYGDHLFVMTNLLVLASLA